MSYQIKQLETKLGCTLVVRQSGAKMRFSAAGESLVKEYLQCEKRLDLALSALQHTRGRGVLRLSTPIDFGSLIMPKLIAALEKVAPELGIDLHSSDEMVDLDHQPWDLAIRGSIEPVDTALFISPLHLLASSAYVKMNGLPASLDDLGKHRILIRQGSNWRGWNALYSSRPQFEKLLTLGNTLGMREAAIQGLGVALLPEFVAMQEIDRGQLIKILPDTTTQIKVYFYISRIESEQTRYYEKLLRDAAAEIDL